MGDLDLVRASARNTDVVQIPPEAAQNMTALCLNCSVLLQLLHYLSESYIKYIYMYMHVSLIIMVFQL